MVDFRPLLFINALALMLLVTAGFASVRKDITLPVAQAPEVEAAIAKASAEPGPEPAETPEPVFADAEPEPEPEPEPLPKNWSLADEIVEASEEDEQVSAEDMARSMLLAKTARQILEEKNAPTPPPEPPVEPIPAQTAEPKTEKPGEQQKKVFQQIAKPIKPNKKKKTSAKGRTTWKRSTKKKDAGTKPDAEKTVEPDGGDA